MALTLSLLALASYLFQFLGLARGSPISVNGTPPFGTSLALPEAFVSYSIEFAFFPDFAGMFMLPIY